MNIYWSGKKIGALYCMMIAGAILQYKLPDLSLVIIPVVAILLGFEKE